MCQSNLHFLCVVTVPYKTPVQNLKKHISSMVSEICELTAHSGHRVVP